MQTYIYFTNESSVPSVSVYIDEEKIISDLLRNDTSSYFLTESGSINLTILNNFAKEILSRRISVPHNAKTKIIITDNGVTFS